ncbi:MAG: transglutaminase domain-containing protein [Phycisphaerales bacterium]|nr:MAG: transglutaminase domain-containing protein [Phycisphaerales bacterium]
MRLLRSYPLLAFLLILLSILGAAIAQSRIDLLVAGTLAMMSWYITEGPRGRSLPKWVSNVLVIAVSLFAVVDVLNHPQAEEIFGVVGRFCVWLSLIKLYERKGPRDHANLLMLSLLMMLSSCLQSANLIFGIVLLLYAGLGIYVLLLYQLYASYETVRARAIADPGQAGLPPAVRPIIGRGVRLHFRMLMSSTAVAGIVLSVLVFVIFPRNVGQSLLSHLIAPPVARHAGFRPEIDLLAGGRITTSRKSVAHLQLLDRANQPMGDGRSLLLRGAVLGKYEGGGVWKPAPSNLKRVETEPVGFSPVRTGIVVPEEVTTFRFDFRTGTETLFTGYAPLAISTGDRRHLLYDPDGQIIRTVEDTGRVYGYYLKVHSNPDGGLLQSMGASPRWRRWSSEVGFPGPDQRYDPEGRVRGLATDLLTQAGLWPPPRRAERLQWNARAATVLTDYLHSGEFSYTLDTSDVVYRDRTEDPIVHFLFESKRGHCEYFASALTAMCHSVGIEARIVVGYVACAWDEIALRYHIVEANAHAWVEVRTSRYGFSEFDPTPPSTIEQMRSDPTTLADRLNWMYQSLESTWSSNVVDFDYGSQTRLASALDVGWAERLGGALDATREWMFRVNRAFHFGPAGYVWMAFVGFALIIAVIALIKLMRRSLAIRRTLHLQHLKGSEYQRMLRQLGFYLDMLRVLHRGRLGKPPWQPPLAYAMVIGEEKPEVAATVRQITDLFYAARYGRQRLTGPQVQEARSLVRELARALKVKL